MRQDRRNVELMEQRITALEAKIAKMEAPPAKDLESEASMRFTDKLDAQMAAASKSARTEESKAIMTSAAPVDKPVEAYAGYAVGKKKVTGKAASKKTK